MSRGSGPRMLALYRDILRAHRAHLRPGLRRFGDQYVAYEFRQHKSAKPDFLPAFEEQWRTYLKTIKESTAGVVPEGPQGIDAQLNDEQKAQLKVPLRRARRAERHGTSGSPRLAHHRLWLPDPRARAFSPETGGSDKEPVMPAGGCGHVPIRTSREAERRCLWPRKVAQQCF